MVSSVPCGPSKFHFLAFRLVAPRYVYVTSKATMNRPLHLYLQSLDLSPCEAEIVVDRAYLPAKRQVQSNQYSCSSFNSRCNSSFVSLHSLPSLTSDSSVSRWDSSIQIKKEDTFAMSPPRRQQRLSLDTILAETNAANRQRSHTNAALSTTTTHPSSPKASSQLLYKKYGSPALPTRGSLSIPPLRLESEGQEERSTDLHDILGQALEQCVDLEEYYFRDDEEEDSLDDDGEAVESEWSILSVDTTQPL